MDNGANGQTGQSVMLNVALEDKQGNNISVHHISILASSFLDKGCATIQNRVMVVNHALVKVTKNRIALDKHAVSK